MKISPSLTTKLPGYHVCLGFGFLLLGSEAKDHLPQAIGSLPIIQLPCAFFTAVMIPFGSFLALRGLVFEKSNRRQLLGWHLLGLSFLPVILSVYFYAFLTMNLVLNLPNLSPNLLPKLVEGARSLPSEQKRVIEAQWAYRIYGTIIAYSRDNLEVVYYVPTEEDKEYWNKWERDDARAKTTTAFIKRMMYQWPYLFGLYGATYLATFTVAGVWLVFKTPKDSAVPTS